LAVVMSHFPTDPSEVGCEIIGRAIDRGQLNGDPFARALLYPRPEPYAVIPHARICAGGGG